jgi:hypothetical protein
MSMFLGARKLLTWRRGGAEKNASDPTCSVVSLRVAPSKGWTREVSAETPGYRTLLRLYPQDYRARFAAETIEAFERAAEERRGQGVPALVGFALAEWIGLAAGAADEWMAKWTTDSSIRGRCLPDIRMMRPPDIPREIRLAGAGCSVRPDTGE